MTTFAERLAELRQEAGLSQRVLAGLVGVNRSQISRWETGNGAIDDQKLTRLADAFSKVLGRQISVDFILGREDRAEVASKDPSNNVAAPRVYPMGMTRQVPVFRKINIGEESDLIGQEDVPMSELRDTTASCFFLEVQDDCMATAGIYRGHRVLIDPGAEIADGDIVLIAFGTEDAQLRRYFRDGDRVLFLADNTSPRPYIITDKDVAILGKMMWGKYYPRK